LVIVVINNLLLLLSVYFQRIPLSSGVCLLLCVCMQYTASEWTYFDWIIEFFKSV